MIKKITLLALLFCVSLSFSQITPVGHLTIFSEDGDKFSLILNGETINDVPQVNLRVEDLNQPYYNAKIKFEDKSLVEITKNNLMLTDVDGIFSDVTYKIRRDKNKAGKVKLNYYSAIPVQPNFIPASNVHVVHYGQPRQVITQQVGGVSQTTTTTTTQAGGLNNGINIGVNVGGINMGVNVNDSFGTGVVTQTTTTTTNTSVNNDVYTHNDTSVRGCNGYSCMTNGNFNSALSAVKNQGFDETKLKTAKQIINDNCLNVDQIIQITNSFGFEETKLDFAKYAYDFCIEPRNYFKLNTIFSFSSSVDELSEYVQSRQ